MGTTKTFILGAIATILLLCTAGFLYHQRHEVLESKRGIVCQGARTSYVNGMVIIGEADLNCMAEVNEKDRVAENLKWGALVCVVVAISGCVGIYGVARKAKK
jgi:hypothetical protein